MTYLKFTLALFLTQITFQADHLWAMEYVDICKSEGDCKSFSRLVMGTDHLIQGNWTHDGQSQQSDEEAFGVLDEAAKLGINFFDTSPIYVGNIENRLGKWKQLREAAYPEQKIYVLSKGGFPFDLFWAKQLEVGTHSEELKDTLIQEGILGSFTQPSPHSTLALTTVPAGTYASRLFGSQEQITQRISEELGHSLLNLHQDITIYLMHRDDGDTVEFNPVSRAQTEVKTIMKAIGSEKVASKFWMHGWSNWQTDRIDESLKIAQDEGSVPKPVINSPYFSLFEMSERSIHAIGVQVTHKEMMDPEFQKGIKLMPYSPLGGFSILDKPEPKWDNAKKDAKLKYEQGDPYWQNVFQAIFTKENEERWYRVVKFTKVFNSLHGTTYTVDQMMNAYVLAHKRTDLLAVGPITTEQVKRTVGSLELAKRLTIEDLDYLYSGT